MLYKVGAFLSLERIDAEVILINKSYGLSSEYMQCVWGLSFDGW